MELRHRGRARVEDSIRAGKDTGMRNLPHYAFEHNQTWLETSLIAQDLLGVDEADLPGRRARDRGAKTPAPKAASHRSQARPSQPTHSPQARSRLALVPSARRGVPAPPDDPGALLSTHRTRGQPLTTNPQQADSVRLPETDRRRHKHHTINDPAGHLRADSDAHPAVHTPTTEPLSPSRP